MYILEVTYTAPIEKIDEQLIPHRSYLDLHYSKGNLICSGPQNPRTGGLIITSFKKREEVDSFISGDPFHVFSLAVYRVIEFDPIKSDDRFKVFIN